MKFACIIKKVFYNMKSKRIIPVGRQKIQINQNQKQKQLDLGQKQQIDVSKLYWQSMNLQELSRLNTQQLKSIKYTINKTKSNFDNKQEDQTLKYNDKILDSFELLMNLKNAKKMAQGKVAELYDLNLSQNQVVIAIIRKTYQNLKQPSKLINYVEPSLIKHLKGLNNDLSGIGKQFEPVTFTIQSIIPIHIQYQFTIGVFRNRSKNSSQDQFIIYDKIIPNPNPSVLLKDQKNKQIILKHIIKKIKPKDAEPQLRIKSILQCIFSGKLHYVKIQFNGPKIVNNNAIHAANPEYRIIDIDGLMNGNPSLKPIFNFL